MQMQLLRNKYFAYEHELMIMMCGLHDENKSLKHLDCILGQQNITFF